MRLEYEQVNNTVRVRWLSRGGGGLLHSRGVDSGLPVEEPGLDVQKVPNEEKAIHTLWTQGEEKILENAVH